ncbi:DUF1822 family protein [Spirulina sp. CS-785/01]|uniref:DUF1822 family protein n=1 Tax=Spirulina sp. CS-785/01 TaxID=3021716 RepID=UPI00232ECCEB|nr:DUF1822 family protein [Spirulina sp. CS-785/01]MDB9315566.1 DUF1822 family protein [Spirulina sp. CS-785/01]
MLITGLITNLIEFRSPEHFHLSIPLKAHQLAQDFYGLQHNPQKAQQVYLNTLAVYGVNCYLNQLGIETELTEAESWNPIMQTLADVADLPIKNWGSLECRPVLPGAKQCKFPPEVWGTRRGYVAVQLNSDLTEGYVLGFLPYVDKEEISLMQFQPAKHLIYYLHDANLVLLGNWFDEEIEAGWEDVTNVLSPHQQKFALPRRKTGVKRGKYLRCERSNTEIILCVGIDPIEKNSFEIEVEVYPMGTHMSLSEGFKVTVCDEEGVVLGSAIAKRHTALRLHFTSQLSQRFKVTLTLGEECIQEFFYI